MTIVFIGLLAALGAGLGPTFSSGMDEVNARWLWAAIGVLVGSALAVVSAVIETRKVHCPICGTSNLGPAH